MTSLKLEFGFDFVIFVALWVTVIITQVADLRKKRVDKALLQLLRFIGIGD